MLSPEELESMLPPRTSREQRRNLRARDLIALVVLGYTATELVMIALKCESATVGRSRLSNQCMCKQPSDRYAGN